MATWTNWAGNVTADVTVAQPSDIADLQSLVTGAAEQGRRVKPIGSGHSFAPIGVTDGVQVRMNRLAGITGVDSASGQVTVLAGTRLHDLNEVLWDHGLCLQNLGDVDVQTISGAISTGTHGTGARIGGLATQVRALDLVLADGSLLHCSATEHPDVFQAARVGLGALGVIASVTLQCEPAFALDAIEATAPIDEVLDGLDELVDGNDHFEFYWFPHTDRLLTKTNNRVPDGTPMRPIGKVRSWIEDDLLSNKAFELVSRVTTRKPHLIPKMNQFAVESVSARDFVDRSYRVLTSKRSVRFRELEFAVPRDAVPEVLRSVMKYLESSGEYVGFPIEFRYAAADDVWLSQAYERESGYIAVHQYHRRDPESYFRAVEQIATDAGGRPHWGKLHYLDAASLRGLYPRFDDFLAVRDRLDPRRVFGNEYLTRVLGS